MIQSINPSHASLKAWLDSETAQRMLDVRPQSLYASVSRGRIRSKPDPDDPRRRLYNRDDVLKLAQRPRGAEPASKVAREAVSWGEPVLSSAVSTVVDGRLYYAGKAVESLVEQGCGLEAIASLLWRSRPVAFDAPARRTSLPAEDGMQRALVAMASAVSAFMVQRERDDDRSPNRPMDVEHAMAREVVTCMADAWLQDVDQPSRALPLHRRIAMAWGRPEAAEVLRMALVLLADHELNASTFSARVAASTGASLAAAVMAGLATLTGPRHGGASSALAALMGEAQRTGIEPTLLRWLEDEGPVPAFDHPLYPDGDARASMLLRSFEPPKAFTTLAADVLRYTGVRPNVDFALAAMAAAHRLPPEAPLALFAIARSVGWIAHAIEQRSSPHIIRPRARYAGPPIESGPR